jgi:hypothetical protein
MKTPISLAILFLLMSTAAPAATITAVQNGNWIASSTWDAGRAPQDNDVVVIPALKVVSFNGTPYAKNPTASRPTLTIKIYGTLDFSTAGNDKLYLNTGSTIQIFSGGKIQTNTSSSDIIAIHNGTDDNTVWNGTPSTISGPASATATTSGFSNSLLPVKLESFTIKRDNKGSATLTWITSSETNSSSFEIERLATGPLNWQVTGNINASGNSSSAHEYNFTVPLYPGENRFRLKQIDADGKFLYSNVISVRYNSNNMDVNYDQSSKQVLIKGVEGADGKIFISDASGHTVYKGSASSPVIFLPATAGIYFVNVVNLHSRFVKKIMVY